ncbi:MAG: hypothetical protein RSG59_07720 [Ruthenibacterium sp.]
MKRRKQKQCCPIRIFRQGGTAFSVSSFGGLLHHCDEGQLSEIIRMSGIGGICLADWGASLRWAREQVSKIPR